MTSHIWGHNELFHILDELGYISLFVIRDPRDSTLDAFQSSIGAERLSAYGYAS